MWNGKVQDSILYEDKDIIVCIKPAGLAVQSARFGTMDLESALKNYLAGLPEEKNTGKAPWLGVVHRLDQPVEGVMVFARTPRAAAELGRQITAKEWKKEYFAVTDCMPACMENTIIKQDRKKSASAAEGSEAEKPAVTGENAPVQNVELRDYLKKDGRTNTSSVVPEGTPGAKMARLFFTVLEEIPDNRTAAGKRVLLGIRLDTGRHHQIRVQMSHAGMPLLGDRKYYSRDSSGFSLALCSCRLSFKHPRTGKKLEFSIIPSGDAFAGFHSFSERKVSAPGNIAK